MENVYQFVGGPYDGKQFVVPGRVDSDLELRVYPVEPWIPGSTYRLGKDGCFRYITFDRQPTRFASDDALVERLSLS